MKKYIFALATLMCGIFTACTDSEEIDIIKSNSVSFEINTQSMYEELNMANSIKNLLRDEVYAVGVTTFIYNKDGNLVDSLFSYVFNTNNITQNFSSLIQGEYTAITIETIVNVNNNYSSWDWAYKGVEKISTLEIEEIDTPYWYAILGTSTKSFTVGDNNNNLSITPKAIGSVVNAYFFNFDKSPVAAVGIGTHELLKSYRLDPSLTENDRYVYDLSQSGYFTTYGYDEVAGENVVEFDIYILGKSTTHMFCYQFEDELNSGSWHLFDSRTEQLEYGKQYYAGYAYLNNDKGTVAQYFGDYTGMATWYSGLTFGTPNTGELLPNLYMSWGASVSSVQSAMSEYTMTLGTSGKAILQEDGSYMISYAGKSKESEISYSFTSAINGLFEIDVLYSKNTVTSSEILNFLNNNYIYLVDENGVYMYCTSDYSSYVMFFEMGDMWYIGFVDVNYLSSMNSKTKIPAYHMPQKKNLSPNTKTLLSESQKISRIFKPVKNSFQRK